MIEILTLVAALATLAVSVVQPGPDQALLTRGFMPPHLVLAACGVGSRAQVPADAVGRLGQ